MLATIRFAHNFMGDLTLLVIVEDILRLNSVVWVLIPSFLGPYLAISFMIEVSNMRYIVKTFKITGHLV